MSGVLLSPITVCIALLFSLSDTPSAGTSATTEAAERIAQRSAENQQAFSTFSCRFKIALGTAPTAAAALRDGPTGPMRFTAEGIWTVKDKVSCYEAKMPEAEVRNAEQLAIADAAKRGVPPQLMLPPLDMKVIGNGQHQWIYHVQFGQLRRGQPGPVSDATMFDMGFGHHSEMTSPAQLIRYGIKQNHEFRFPAADPSSKHLHQVELVEPIMGDENKKLLTSMKFDADRGFLPTEVSVGFLGKKPGVTTTVTSSKKADHGAWYPERTVQIEFPRDPAGMCQVQEIVVTSMRLTVEDEQLQITVPQGTAIVDGETEGAAPIFSQDTVIKSDRLERITSDTKSSTISIIKRSASKKRN